jgi:hypothetical protein
MLVCPSPRNYTFLECVAFPKIDQIAVFALLECASHFPNVYLGVVAADTKRAAFQQLWGYITVRLKFFFINGQVLCIARETNLAWI